MLQCIAGAYSLDGPFIMVWVHFFFTRLFFCVAVYMRGPIQSGGRCVAVCCIVLQCVAVCCCMLQCVAVYIRGSIHERGPFL